MKKVVLQREYQGQDSWMAYKEQVTIDKDNNLDYRRTEGGNCEFGEWQPFRGEKKALNFIFGNITVTESLINSLKECLSKQIELKDDEFNMECY